jgi:hypothetical protein
MANLEREKTNQDNKEKQNEREDKSRIILKIEDSNFYLYVCVSKEKIPALSVQGKISV